MALYESTSSVNEFSSVAGTALKNGNQNKTADYERIQ